MGRKINRKKTYRKKTNRRKISRKKTNRRKNTRRITNMKRRRNIRKKYRGGMPSDSQREQVIARARIEKYNDDFRRIAGSRPMGDVESRKNHFETEFKPKFLEYMHKAPLIIMNTDNLLDICKKCTHNRIDSQMIDPDGAENNGIFLEFKAFDNSTLYKLVKIMEGEADKWRLCMREWYYSLVGYNSGIAPRPILIYICKTRDNSNKQIYYIIMSYEKKVPYMNMFTAVNNEGKKALMFDVLRVIQISIDFLVKHGDAHSGNMIVDPETRKVELIDWAHCEEREESDTSLTVPFPPGDPGWDNKIFYEDDDEDDY